MGDAILCDATVFDAIVCDAIVCDAIVCDDDVGPHAARIFEHATDRATHWLRHVDLAKRMG